nr:site-specific integrase [Roseomonas genomospecies 6]
MRVRVPVDLVPLFGRVELRRSLGTSSPDAARAAAGAASSILFAEFREIRALSESDEEKARQRVHELLYRKADVAVELAGTQTRVARLTQEKADLESIRDRRTIADLAAVNAALVTEAPRSRRAPAPTPKAKHDVASAFRDRYITEKTRGGWTEQTKRQDTRSIELFLEIAGDKVPSDYSRDDITRFRSTLELIPTNHGKHGGAVKGERPILDVIEDADDEQPRLALKTLKRHWTAAKAFLEWASVHSTKDAKLDPDILKKHKWSTDVRKSQHRKPWTTDTLKKLFASPLYAGCAGADRSQRWRAGDTIIRDAFFWVPLLCLYSGMRAEEASRLRPEDVKEVDGTWVIDITTEGHSRLKNDGAVRRVPVHDTLIRCGLTEHAQEMVRRRADQLFPELKPGGVDSKLSHEVGHFFTDYRKAVGLYEYLMDLHSLRKTFATLLIRNGNRIIDVDELIGHDSTSRVEQKELLHSMTLAHYYGGEELLRLKNIVNGFDPGLDLSHLHLNAHPRR